MGRQGKLVLQPCSHPPDLGHCQLASFTRVPRKRPAVLSAQLGSKAKGMMPAILPFLSTLSMKRTGRQILPQSSILRTQRGLEGAREGA